MQSLATKEINNDLYKDKYGNLAIVEDLGAVRQVTLSSVKLQLGELKYDTDRGVPYLETVFSDIPNIPLWESYMITAASDVTGVDRIESIESRVEDGILKYDMYIATIYGEMSING